MLFSWFRNRRRRQLLSTPFPDAWEDVLDEHCPLCLRLDPPDQQLLRDRLRIFVAEKHWEGCRGLEVTDAMRVTVAAHATLLGLHLDDTSFDKVQTILLYPQSFVAPPSDDLDEDGVGPVDEGEERLGEAWYRGPVVLSWADTQTECLDPEAGRNVVLHEFAHQLDMLDGVSDGTPPLRSREQYQQWRQVMTREFKKLVRAADRGRATLLDEYGAENESEFFAVASEFFFCLPLDLRIRHRDLYDTLRDYYGQDPAAWFTS